MTRRRAFRAGALCGLAVLGMLLLGILWPVSALLLYLRLGPGSLQQRPLTKAASVATATACSCELRGETLAPKITCPPTMKDDPSADATCAQTATPSNAEVDGRAPRYSSWLMPRTSSRALPVAGTGGFTQQAWPSPLWRTQAAWASLRLESLS